MLSPSVSHDVPQCTCWPDILLQCADCTNAICLWLLYTYRLSRPATLSVFFVGVHVPVKSCCCIVWILWEHRQRLRHPYLDSLTVLTNFLTCSCWRCLVQYWSLFLAMNGSARFCVELQCTCTSEELQYTVYMHQFHVTVSLFHIRVTITCYKVHVCTDYVLQSTCMYQLRVTVYMH